MAGDGLGENFTGIMTVTGTQTLAAPVGPASALDNIRKAITLVRVNARSAPNAVVLNPTDAQNIDLLKENAEINNFVGPGPYGIGTPRLWGAPVVETSALTAGTALVGDFTKAVLFDRSALSITLGTINDQFVRNMVTVLGERRAGFGVIRPALVRLGDPGLIAARQARIASSAVRAAARLLTPRWVASLLAENQQLRAKLAASRERASHFKWVIKRQRRGARLQHSRAKLDRGSLTALRADVRARRCAPGASGPVEAIGYLRSARAASRSSEA